MTRQSQTRERSGCPLEVVSPWVRIDPVDGRNIDAHMLRDPDAATLADTDGVVSLTAARNEYVSFQLIVRNGGRPIREVRLSFGGLKGPKGARIGRAEFEPHIEWYHDADDFGWIPDALVPLGKADGPVGVPWKQCGVPGQTAQGFWLDLFIPQDSPAGTYEGALTVTIEGDRTRVPIRLKVLPITVPNECSIVADMNYYALGLVRGWPDMQSDPEGVGLREHLQAERHMFRCAHEHRALYHYLPYSHSGRIEHPSFIPTLAGAGKAIRVKSWSAFDRRMGPLADGSAFKTTRRGPIPVPYMYTPHNFTWPADFARFGTKGYRTEWRRIGQACVDHFREKGWTETRFELFFNHKQRYKYFPWDGDEIRFAEDTDHMYLFRDLSRGIYDAADPVQFIWRVDSSWRFAEHCRSDLADFVKLWVASTRTQIGAPDSPKVLHAKGAAIFHYGGPSMLEVPLSWVWIWPTKTLARGNDGFTWSLTTQWNPDCWRQAPGHWNKCVFYPGSPWGGRDVVAGIRTKALRNAMQTIEYAFMLDKKRGPGAAMSIINAVLGTDDDFWWDRASDLPRRGSDAHAIANQQLRDPLSWSTVRRRLAEALMQ